MKELRDNGVLVLDIDGNRVELAEEDLLIETAQSEGYVTETDGETSVVLDTNLTPELIQEGLSARSSARFRPCVKRLVSKSWTRSLSMQKITIRSWIS